MAIWIYRLSDGLIDHVSQYDNAIKTGANYGVVQLPNSTAIDTILHRIDVNTKQLRLATPQELINRETELANRLLDNDTFREDILAMIAYIIRRENPAAFDALTNQQKRTQILNQAQIYRTIRSTIKKSDFI